jgi:hypothetical protein
MTLSWEALTGIILALSMFGVALYSRVRPTTAQAGKQAYLSQPNDK